jgi:uncharacterized protein YukE
MEYFPPQYVIYYYAINQCIQEFRQKFPNLVTTYKQLVKQIHACVDKFRETGSAVKQGAGHLVKEPQIVSQMFKKTYPK